MADVYKYMKPGFPNVDEVDVYAYTNNYDYTQWGVDTTIRILKVPWDLSYENVVKFDDDAARDAWTRDHTLATYKLQTAINMQPDNSIKLPIPFDELAKCNFVVVEFPKAPVDYFNLDTPRISSFGYFISDVMQLSPSTTQAFLTVDFWYTFINDVDITYIDLERGHAPMAETRADKFLDNPRDNCTNLLTPDFDLGNRAERVKQAAEWIANQGELYAVFAITSNAGSQYWGSNGQRNMNVPGIAHPGYEYIAVYAPDLERFLIQCNQNRPHFLQTVAGLFFVTDKMITLGAAITWPGFDMEVHFIITGQRITDVLTLDKDIFGYDANYRDIAKLYTAPYAYLQITDDQGNASVVEIESTDGKISISSTLNMIYPFIGYDITLLDIGGGNRSTTAFHGNGYREMIHSGRWAEFARSLSIPAYIVTQSQEDRIQFDRFFSNAQAVNDYTTSYNNTIEQYTATYNNTVDSNATNYNNAISSNLTSNTNALASNTANYQIADGVRDTNNTNIVNAITNAYDLAIDGNVVAYNDSYNQIVVSKKAFEAGIANDLIAAMNGGISTITGTVGSAAAGNAAGAIGGAADLVTGVVSFPLVLSNNADVYQKSREAAIAHMEGYYGTASIGSGTLGYGARSATATKDLQIANQDRSNQREITNNTTSKTTADDNANRTKSNADSTALASKNTSDGNAARTQAAASVVNVRNRNNAMAAIDNGNRQQKVSPPAVYASNSNGQTAETRPIGMFVNLVTESDAAIKAAGDYFLRWGYALEQAWIPTKLQMMKHFTYWKARDVWISGRGITIEDATETIKKIFVEGTTIWSNPDDIAAVSIYDNF